MKSLLISKRSKVILGIVMFAIGIGAISKKVISYPSGGCMKGPQKMTFDEEIKGLHYLENNLYSLIDLNP